MIHQPVGLRKRDKAGPAGLDKWIKGILSARLMHSVLERLSKYKNPELTTPYIEIRFIPLSVYPFIGIPVVFLYPVTSV